MTIQVQYTGRADGWCATSLDNFDHITEHSFRKADAIKSARGMSQGVERIEIYTKTGKLQRVENPYGF